MPPIPARKPSTLDPGQSSVLDPAWLAALRRIADLVGANDPASQVMGIASPIATVRLATPEMKRAAFDRLVARWTALRNSLWNQMEKRFPADELPRELGNVAGRDVPGELANALRMDNLAVTGGERAALEDTALEDAKWLMVERLKAIDRSPMLRDLLNLQQRMSVHRGSPLDPGIALKRSVVLPPSADTPLLLSPFARYDPKFTGNSQLRRLSSLAGSISEEAGFTPDEQTLLSKVLPPTEPSVVHRMVAEAIGRMRHTEPIQRLIEYLVSRQ